MKAIPFSKTLATLSFLGMAFLGGISTAKAESWGELHDAVEQLEHAKHADHPIEHLEKAKFHLEEAGHHHHWERAEAVHQINEAIESIRKGEHGRMDEHVDRAIHEIHESEK